MTLGKVLKRIRKTKQIPQKEIVKVLKISKSTVYRFEKGGNIDTNNYLKYCEYLGIDAGIPYFISNHDDFYRLFNRITRSSFDYEVFELAFSKTLIKTAEQIFDNFLYKQNKTLVLITSALFSFKFYIRYNIC